MPITQARMHALAKAAESWMNVALQRQRLIREFHDQWLQGRKTPHEIMTLLGDLATGIGLPLHEEAMIIAAELQHIKFTTKSNEKSRLRMARKRNDEAHESAKRWVQDLITISDLPVLSPSTPMTREQQSSLAKALAKEKELRAQAPPEPYGHAEAPEDSPQTAEDTILPEGLLDL